MKKHWSYRQTLKHKKSKYRQTDKKQKSSLIKFTDISGCLGYLIMFFYINTNRLACIKITIKIDKAKNVSQDRAKWSPIVTAFLYGKKVWINNM